MLLFSLTAFPLAILYFLVDTNRFRLTLAIKNSALGFLCFLPSFMLLSMIDNGLKINWTNPLLLTLFFFLRNFFLPCLLAWLCYSLLLIKKVITPANPSLFFYLAFLGLLVITRAFMYHHYYGFYELIALPFTYLVLSGLLTKYFSNQQIIITNLLLLLMLAGLCAIQAVVAYYFASNRYSFALIFFIINLIVCTVIALFAPAIKKNF